MPQTRNLDVIPVNIYEENSACNFQVHSEREWTLVKEKTLKNVKKKRN